MYSFTPTASDQNGNALLFGIDAKPTWASFNTTTGQLTGTPTAADVGTYRGIVIWVTDGKSDAALPAFDVTVQGQSSTTNRAPLISGKPALTVVVGAAYAFTPTASDPDGDNLSFTIQNPPAWATFDPTTGTLQGAPQAAGSYANIVIAVSDGNATVPLPPFTIVVTTQTTTNSPPTISGTPMTSVEAGTSYSFVPTASDADNDPLAFSIANKPSWAQFNTATGALTGTPAGADVGTTTGIVISVSDGKVSTPLAPFSIAVVATATGSATITWNPPTTNTDGSALTDLAGFRIYWGTTRDDYPNSVAINSPGISSYVITDLVAGTYFFVMTSLNSSGEESAYSNAASKTIQ
jgi:hypothetical protein